MALEVARGHAHPVDALHAWHALLGGQAEAQLFHLACSTPPFLMLPGLERLGPLGIVLGAGLDGHPRGLEPGQRLGDPRPFGLPLRSQDVVGCLPHRIQAWIGKAMDPSTMSCGRAAWPVAAALVGTSAAVRAWDELTNAPASTQVAAAWKKAVSKWGPEVRETVREAVGKDDRGRETRMAGLCWAEGGHALQHGRHPLFRQPACDGPHALATNRSSGGFAGSRCRR